MKQKIDAYSLSPLSLSHLFFNFTAIPEKTLVHGFNWRAEDLRLRWRGRISRTSTSLEDWTTDSMNSKTRLRLPRYSYYSSISTLVLQLPNWFSWVFLLWFHGFNLLGIIRKNAHLLNLLICISRLSNPFQVFFFFFLTCNLLWGCKSWP